MTEWQPYYVAYAAAHGRTPGAQLEADRESRPAASMLDFMGWVQDRCAEFDPSYPRQPIDPKGFGEWLAERYPVHQHGQGTVVVSRHWHDRKGPS